MGTWAGKKVLFIGDSITARRVYPETVKDILGIEVFYHCKGGVGLVSMVDGDKGLGGDYDNYTAASGVLKPLCAEDVADKDLVVLFGGYNNRHNPIGRAGDCYSPTGGDKTVAGMMQYCINRIYEELAKANNLTCKLLIVTVDYTGKNMWIDANGFEEIGAKGSGKSYENIANVQVEVARRNAIPVCDLFHTSGINPYTWSVFGFESEAENKMYSPYRLDEHGMPVSDEHIRYVKGESYYQWRDGKVVLEEYTGVTEHNHPAPYPYNRDHIHKSPEGYKRMGEVIAGAIISAYGN